MMTKHEIFWQFQLERSKISNQIALIWAAHWKIQGANFHIRRKLKPKFENKTKSLEGCVWKFYILNFGFLSFKININCFHKKNK